MLINRRHLLVAGSAVGLTTLLAACDQSPQTPASGGANGGAEATGGGALYDGSAIDPIDSQPINNPTGWKDRPMGGVDARVTVVEYVSPTCPFCANFHATVLPQLKTEYIDTGRVRFIARPFRRNVLDIAVFVIAEAAGEAYSDVLAAYMASQNQWASAASPREALFAVAQQFGFTQERFEQALEDEEMFAAVEALREQAINQFGVQGTPTFFINGQRLETNATYESLSAEINSRL